MFARRKELMQQLQEANDGTQILEITILLLFQQTRNVVICGKHITRVCLNQLLQEKKKIPSEVRENLIRLQSLLQSSALVPSDLLETIKAYGCSKDISTFGEG